jgi:hypothetical protein
MAAMKEAEGCAFLTERFTSAGFTILCNVQMEIAGTVVNLDGWDAEKRVGFEYITKEAGDDAEFTPEVLRAFEEKMRAGELHVFLIDEVATEAELREAADAFLSELAKRKGAP